jgi:hypothetical protein
MNVAFIKASPCGGLAPRSSREFQTAMIGAMPLLIKIGPGRCPKHRGKGVATMCGGLMLGPDLRAYGDLLNRMF